MKPPVVSIVISLYNGEAHIRAALASARAQDYPHTEIIVVDDGSIDGGGVLIRDEPDIQYILQTNAGNAAARNTGIARASGEFIALLDQDDIWLPQKLRLQVEALQQNPHCGFSICQTILKIEEGMVLPSSYGPVVANQPFPAYLPSALMMRRATAAAVGAFNTDYAMGNDSDWFFRAKDAGIEGVVVPEVLFEKRVHPENQGHDTKVMRQELMALVRASALRKRKQAHSAPSPSCPH